METENHKILKFKALEYLFLTKECKYVTTELKIGDYIFDCIGTDGYKVYIIEAKQEYSDFLNDCNKLDDIRNNINEFKRLLTETADVKKYTDLIQKEQEKSWKFYDPALLKLSVERYVITPEDLVKTSEIPDNWGLLEVDDQGNTRRIVKSESSKFEPRFSQVVVREIARRNTKMFLESQGVSFENKVVQFPNILLEDK